MKHSFFIWLSCLCLVPMFVFAQNPESFLKTNGTVWLNPVEDNEYQEATSQAESVYAEANNVLNARERAIV